MYFLLKAEKTTRVASNILAKTYDEAIPKIEQKGEIHTRVEIDSNFLKLQFIPMISNVRPMGQV